MTVFNPKITDQGLAALYNAQSTGVDLEITHIGFGVGAYDPVGNESALQNEVKRVAIGSGYRISANQIRVSAIWVSNTDQAEISEVGFYAGSVLFAVVSRSIGGPYLYKTPGANLIFSYDWKITSVSIDNISFSVDPDASALLVHLNDQNAHPQYLTIAEYLQRDHKNSARAATTANIALSGLQTIDGIALSAGDRVLVKNQTQSQYNGIYVASSGAWSRATDADSGAKISSGLQVSVEQGAINADSIWQLTTDGAITLDTTQLVFGIVSGPTGITAGTYRSVTVDSFGRVIDGSNPVIAVSEGGTGATTPDQARENLGIPGVIQAAIAALVNSSPAALDTLSELATSLGNDPNFATTVINALAGKENVLGFTPLQQGGGAGMQSNKVMIGFDGNGNLIFQVDVTSFGRLWSENNQLGLGTTAESARAALYLGDAATLNGTSLNTPGTIVVRDGNGDVAVRYLVGELVGLAERATKLNVARTINGVPFDGTANISITTVPTAPPGSNSTLIANTAFVQAAIAALVNSSPAALDTLNELAIALGNDPNFATTVTNALAGKVNRDSITDAGFANGDTNYPYFRNAADGIVHYLQKALGFTPVRQGGGAYQLTNTVYIGFDGADLRAQVDATDFGALWSAHNAAYKLAAMEVGSIGTYALCLVGGGSAGVAVPAGTLVSGSNLRYAAASGDYSGTPAGTWRVMGHLYDANLDDTNSVTLCQRVS